MRHIPVIGTPVAATDYPGAVAWILDRARAGDKAYAVEAANTHVLSLARQDDDFGGSLKEFDLILPDGMPLVWVINASLDRQHQLKDRVYGPTLMLEVLRATQGQPDFRHFLLGGKTSTLEKLQASFAARFPDSQIVGSYSPPFGPWPESESRKIADAIRRSGANLVWVGLGCPKQEHWIAHNKAQLPPAVYFGIGAAFAFHAGEVRQSPALLQKLGLEWAYRLAMEPRRLFKRYLVHNSLFLYHLLRDHMRDR